MQRLLWAGVLLVLWALFPVRASGSGTDPYLIHINQARVDGGLEPLTWEIRLTWAIGAHLEHLAVTGVLEHNYSDGTTPTDRAREKGYTSDYVGEVLAKNTVDAAQAVRLWLESPPHRAVLMDPTMVEIGLWVHQDGEGHLFVGALLGDGKAPAPDRGERIASRSMEYLGYPYLWGGLTPRGFDCAGFVTWVYRELGVELGTTYIPSMLNHPRVEMGSLRAGDIIVFRDTYKPGISHVGIYVGGGYFSHAANPTAGVIVSPLSGYWASKWAGASRPW